ncbi:hypothetical protein M2275_008145 [Rhodococcus opacus]|nr:hypothetical protein [Rhodococcus opacus]
MCWWHAPCRTRTLAKSFRAAISAVVGDDPIDVMTEAAKSTRPRCMNPIAVAYFSSTPPWRRRGGRPVGSGVQVHVSGASSGDLVRLPAFVQRSPASTCTMRPGERMTNRTWFTFAPHQGPRNLCRLSPRKGRCRLTVRNGIVVPIPLSPWVDAADPPVRGTPSRSVPPSRSGWQRLVVGTLGPTNSPSPFVQPMLRLMSTTRGPTTAERAASPDGAPLHERRRQASVHVGCTGLLAGRINGLSCITNALTDSVLGRHGSAVRRRSADSRRTGPTLDSG